LIPIRKARRRLFGIAAGVLLALPGCSNRPSADLMAKVNGYKIYRSEVDKSFNKQIAGATQKLTPEQEQALRLQILQQIIGFQLYLQKAEKLGIVATDEEVENRINKASFTKEEFAKRLEEMGLSEGDYRQEVRKNLTIDKLLNKEIASKVSISDTDIQNYYNEHKAQFNVIEPQYYMAQIFVSSNPTVPAGSIPNKAQNEAQPHVNIKTIYNRLESGEDFATVASKYSEDLDTGRSGGELGAIPESTLKTIEPATREAVLKLKPNQFTAVIPVTSPVPGYRIVKLLGKEAAGQRDLNDPSVQQLIRNQLRNQREQYLRAAYDENLRDNAQIRNYYVEQILKNAAGQK